MQLGTTKSSHYGNGLFVGLSVKVIQTSALHLLEKWNCCFLKRE